MCVTAVLHLGVPVGNSIDRQWGTFLGGEVWATRARHFSFGGDEDFRSVLARGGPDKLHKVGGVCLLGATSLWHVTKNIWPKRESNQGCADKNAPCYRWDTT